MEALLKNNQLDYNEVIEGLNISRSALKWFEENGIIKIESKSFTVILLTSKVR